MNIYNLLLLFNLFNSTLCLKGFSRNNLIISTKTKLNMNLLDLNNFKYIASLPIMYSCMSINEYITHKYYQHEEIKKIFKNLSNKRLDLHLEHHMDINNNMTLRTDDKWLKSISYKKLSVHDYRGTAFSYKSTLKMIIQMIITSYPIFYLINFTFGEFLILLIPLMIIHAILWNSMHPYMHDLDDVNWNYGFKSLSFIRNTSYYKYIYNYHKTHHLIDGSKNYNVCCPGADYLFGTYQEN
jgi:hypothetical protein